MCAEILAFPYVSNYIVILYCLAHLYAFLFIICNMSERGLNMSVRNHHRIRNSHCHISLRMLYKNEENVRE